MTTPKPTPTVTPRALEAYVLDRGWSSQRLSDAIYDATGIRISYRTIDRYRMGIGRQKKVTLHAVQRYMARARQESAR